MSERLAATTVLAKTRRPDIGNVLPRERLFARLDGTASRKVAWIWGAAGSGKSTLAASWLDARELRSAWYGIDSDDDVASFFHYLTHAVRHLHVPATVLPRLRDGQVDDIAAFSRAWFRAMFAKAGPGSAVVLDNLDVVAPDSAVHVALEAGLSQVPPGCCVVVTSREAPPPAFSRMRASDQMVVVGGDALRIDATELASVAHLRGCAPLGEEALRAIQARAQGWAAGLVLMLEHAKLTDTLAEPPQDATPTVVFDYLAGEIFDRFEPGTRRFLLAIACLPRMTAEVAKAMSGEPAAARLLRNLVLNDYFVRELADGKQHVFVVHPLLRQFLLGRTAADMPDAVGADALRRGAALLREAGLAEDAVELYVACSDWQGVASIAREQADALFAAGRHATLASWIELLPPAMLQADAHLLCLHAEGRLPTTPRGARHAFERAFALATNAGDAPMRRRACAGAIEATVREFDDLAPLDLWIETLERGLADAATDAGASATLAKARLLRDPRHPSLHTWATRMLADSDEATEEHRALACVVMALVDGDFERCARHARALIDETESTIGQRPMAWAHATFAAASLAMGEIEEASQSIAALDAFPMRRGDRAIAHALRGAAAWMGGDATLAMREMKQAVLVSQETGLSWIEAAARLVLAQLSAEIGEAAGAQAHLRATWTIATRFDSAPLRVAADLLEASLSDSDAVAEPLARGLALARTHGLRHVPMLDRPRLASLCAIALQRKIEPEFVRSLVHELQLPPPDAARRLARWPWRFRIETLGGFELSRGGQPIGFSAKGPGRPIELLKLMAALGGHGVRVEQLAETLWPHVDADYAYKSFTATLHRLRRIFEDDAAVLLRDGRLGLNRDLVWLDAWALEDVIAELETQLRAPGRVAPEQVEEALTLYRGAFLPDEDDQPAYAARREQLRTRLARNLARVVRDWEEAGAGDAVIDLCSRLVDADESCEAFHRQLMASQQRQGDIAGAIGTYERLCKVLAARTKAQPSPETQAVYASLRA